MANTYYTIKLVDFDGMEGRMSFDTLEEATIEALVLENEGFTVTSIEEEHDDVD